MDVIYRQCDVYNTLSTGNKLFYLTQPPSTFGFFIIVVVWGTRSARVVGSTWFPAEMCLTNLLKLQAGFVVLLHLDEGKMWWWEQTAALQQLWSTGRLSHFYICLCTWVERISLCLPSIGPVMVDIELRDHMVGYYKSDVMGQWWSQQDNYLLNYTHCNHRVQGRMEPLGGRAVDYVTVILVLYAQLFNIRLELWPVVYPWPYNNNLCIYIWESSTWLTSKTLNICVT